MTLSASQAPSSSQRNFPKIFVGKDGSPLKVFVESNGVSENRPRLIRSLRNHGAHISSDLSSARIILVEPNSSEGRQFVRDWGADPDKVVLEIAWVRRCTEAGRALLEEDDWAGCGDLDGTPLPEDGEDEDGDAKPSSASLRRKAPNSAHSRTPDTMRISSESQPPLPTPRSTPMGASDPLQTNSSTAFTQAIPSSSRRVPSPSTSAPTALSSTSAVPSSTGMRMQSPQRSFAFNPQYDQSIVTQQHAMTIAQNVSANAIAAYIAQNPEFMQSLLYQGIVQNTAAHAHGWPQSPPFNQQPKMYPTIPLQGNPTHMDYREQDMRGMQTDMHFPYGQIIPSQFRAPVPLEMQETVPPRAPSTPSSDSTLHPMSPTLALNGDNRPEFSEGPSNARKRRLGDVLEESSSSLADRRPSQSSAPGSTDNGLKRRKSSPLSSQQSSSHSGIFTKDGRSLDFFIQVQVRNRIDLVKQVKRNGGQICFEPSDADFIILAPQHDKMAEQWMKSVIDLGRYALRPAFIEACLEEGALVEDDEFKMGHAKSSKKAALKKKKVRRKEESPATSAASEERMSKSPTPPPPSSSSRRRGRPAYTEGERAYAFKYAAYAFSRRPILSLNALGEELAERVSSHLASSWTSYIHAYADDFEKIRSEALDHPSDVQKGTIASEDAEIEPLIPPLMDLVVADDTTKKLPPNDAGALTAGVNGSINEHAAEDKSQDMLETDLNTIVNYFANTPEGVEGDDQLWAHLAKSHKCLTSTTWQDFYQAHEDDVNNRLMTVLDIK